MISYVAEGAQHGRLKLPHLLREQAPVRAAQEVRFAVLEALGEERACSCALAAPMPIGVMRMGHHAMAYI